MCGICGFVSKNRIEKDILIKMNDTMYHRGPNDSGEEIHQTTDKWVGLAQRRLSIIDLSPLGHQPMYSNDKRVGIVFNGEIYNYKEIKKELNEYKFKSTSDTEVIIAAYQKWGLKFINKLNGMFAIAIYDFIEDELILVRDRIGEKPLYYYYSNGDIAFGSELKPIMLYPFFKKNINTEIIAKYLFHGYINAPETIFKETYKIEPGEILIFKNGEVNKKKYWDAIEKFSTLRKDPISSYKKAKSELTSLVEDSVNIRMNSDVPLGTFLSGGIDSTLVTAIAQNNSQSQLKTFSIGFKEKEYNEAVFAKDIAQYLGTEHTELYIEDHQMKSLVYSIPDYYDEPMADSSQIPTMLLSELAKSKVTVALSGDGGDELFCGYGRYEKVRIAQRYEPIGLIINNLLKLPVINQIKILNQLPVRVQTLILNRDKRQQSQFTDFGNIELCKKMVINQQNEIKYPIEHLLDTSNWMQRLMLVDLLTVLPEDLLQKVDKATMKYSLEGRAPILDYRIIEYSFRLPHKFKYNQGIKKYILKDILNNYVPKELTDRPKKGFSVPIQKWLKNDLMKKIKFFSIPAKLNRQGIFNHEIINNMILELENTSDNNKSKVTKYLWSYFVFQIWYNKYIEEL